MPDNLVLSVLDQSPVSEGSTGSDALHNSIDLARLTEELGYYRYWVAEHHGTPMVASASPEVLIAAIGAATSRLRIGSGGVMLPHYSPLKVAETFSMLTGLYPGRIDLGIGRAPGTDPETMYVLQRDRRQVAPNDFREQLEELLGYFDRELPTRAPAGAACGSPGRSGSPGGLAPRLVFGQRPLGGGVRAALLVCRLHQSAGSRDGSNLSRALLALGSVPDPAHHGRSGRDLCRDR